MLKYLFLLNINKSKNTVLHTEKEKKNPLKIKIFVLVNIHEQTSMFVQDH